MNDDTEVYGSCSATLNGELFVFGGSSSRKQVFIRCQGILDSFLNFIMGHNLWPLDFKNNWLWIETNW